MYLREPHCTVNVPSSFILHIINLAMDQSFIGSVYTFMISDTSPSKVQGNQGNHCKFQPTQCKQSQTMDLYCLKIAHHSCFIIPKTVTTWKIWLPSSQHIPIWVLVSTPLKNSDWIDVVLFPTEWPNKEDHVPQTNQPAPPVFLHPCANCTPTVQTLLAPLNDYGLRRSRGQSDATRARGWRASGRWCRQGPDDRRPCGHGTPGEKICMGRSADWTDPMDPVAPSERKCLGYNLPCFRV